MSNRRYLGRQYEAAMEEGPKYAQYPDEYHPVAYRVMITGIHLADSGFDPDDYEGYIEEIVQDMIRSGTADMRLYRLTDAPEVTEEQKAEWQAERLRKANADLENTEKVRKAREYERAFIEGEEQNPFNQDAKPSAFQSAVDTVTGIYKAQGIIDGGSE